MFFAIRNRTQNINKIKNINKRKFSCYFVPWLSVLRNNFSKHTLKKTSSNNCCFFIAPINLSIENISNTHTHSLQLPVAFNVSLPLSHSLIYFFLYSFFKCILRSVFLTGCIKVHSTKQRRLYSLHFVIFMHIIICFGAIFVKSLLIVFLLLFFFCCLLPKKIKLFFLCCCCVVAVGKIVIGQFLH